MHPPPSLLLYPSSSPAASPHSPPKTPFRHIPLLPDTPPPQQCVEHDASRHPGRLSPVPRNMSPRRPPGLRIPDRLKPWLGIGSWAVTSLGFLLAIAFWKKEVFTGLDELSHRLQSLGHLGYAILFCLIFLTTIPPFPLYSTLTILSGYTFGPWIGAAIAYAAALSGAVIVFQVSRQYLGESMTRMLSHAVSLKRVVRAIEKRPTLLLLVRVAPYPYNLMNVLLASSRILTFRTYVACTALSLFKVIIHTSVGSGMHSFAGHHAALGDGGGGAARGVGRAWTGAGIVLCVGSFVYLACVARRAVDAELGDEGRAGVRDVRDVEAGVGLCATDGSAAEMREVRQQRAADYI